MSKNLWSQQTCPRCAFQKRVVEEKSEAILIFAVFVVIFWAKNSVGASIYFLAMGVNWVYSTAIYAAGSLCLLFIMEIVVRRRRLSVVGFRLPINKRALLVFAGVAALLLFVGITVHAVVPDRAAYMVFFNQYFFSVVILSPFFEEVVFRSLIQTRLEAGFGIIKSWILSSLLFGLFQFIAGYFARGQSFSPTDVVSLQLTYALVFGVLAGVFFAKTRSLLPSFLLHVISKVTLDFFYLV